MIWISEMKGEECSDQEWFQRFGLGEPGRVMTDTRIQLLTDGHSWPTMNPHLGDPINALTKPLTLHHWGIFADLWKSLLVYFITATAFLCLLLLVLFYDIKKIPFKLLNQPWYIPRGCSINVSSYPVFPPQHFVWVLWVWAWMSGVGLRSAHLIGS